MLEVLRSIVQELNLAHDLNEALDIIVRRIKEAIGTEACSIFLVDPEKKQFVLMATDGLNQEMVRKTRFDLNKGLVGLIGQRGEPINVEDAQNHPSYLQFKQIGEENFNAFLGAPIIYHKRLLGVVTVQQEQQRCYDQTEESFLVTLSAQLATVIAHAEAIGEAIYFTPEKKQEKSNKLKTTMGLGCVSGVGIGTIVVRYPLADISAVPDKAITDVEHEIQLLDSSITATYEEFQILSQQLEATLPQEERGLFDAYFRIIKSKSLRESIVTLIKEGHWAQWALRKVIKKHISEFESMEDEYLRERATDFRDLGRRILAHLQSQQQEKIDYPAQTILAGEELTAATLAEIPEEKLVGVISLRGSKNSHTAIIARALGIPTVMGVQGVSLSQLDGQEAIVDGYSGQIHFNPGRRLLKQYTKLANEEKELDAGLVELRNLPAETLDKHKVSLYVNTGLAVDARTSLSVGAEGVGLYRTEVPFMTRNSFPTEEEQRIIYKQLLKAFAPQPVIMRTLDIGGDKALPYFPIQDENPFLGWRGIRVTLDHPEVFLVQIRAMLRASEGLNNLKIMLPMVSSITEIDEALKLFHQAYEEVNSEDSKIALPELGVMVEVPAIIYQIPALAKRVNFISIGSNDLTQYLLAVDRNNSHVANLYDSLHPAVIRALVHIFNSAHQEQIQTSICGELASDPAGVIVLLGIGFETLSMNSTILPRIKWVIRNFTLAKARQLLKEVLEYETTEQVREHLNAALVEAGLGGLIRAGKS